LPKSPPTHTPQPRDHPRVSSTRSVRGSASAGPPRERNPPQTQGPRRSIRNTDPAERPLAVGDDLGSSDVPFTHVQPSVGSGHSRRRGRFRILRAVCFGGSNSAGQLRDSDGAGFAPGKRLPLLPALRWHCPLRDSLHLSQRPRHLHDASCSASRVQRADLRQLQRTLAVAQVPLLRHATSNTPPPLGLRLASEQEGHLRDANRRLPTELRTLTIAAPVQGHS
jgi:hypothetical protein